LWDKQREAVNSVLVDKNRKTAIRSCHDSGKTFIDARIGLLYLITNENSLVVTTAPSWTQVKEILWREIGSAYNSSIASIGGSLTTTKLDFGDDWFAIGLSTRKEGDATDVADRMLGFHSKTGKILVIVDEGSGVKEPVWGAIDGLLTSSKAQLLASGNPYSKTGSFAKLFSSKGVYKIHIQDTDIPNIKENKIIIPGLMSPLYPNEMAEKYGESSNLYKIKVKGEFPSTEKDTLVSIDQIEKAFIREQDATGKKMLGVDVARYGDNFTVLLVRQGKKILSKEKYPKTSVPETIALVKRKIESASIDPVNVEIDDVGLGGGVVDGLQQDDYNVNGVNAGAVADDDEHYSNIRAENYWAIKDWIKTADIPKDDDYYQLGNIKYKWKSDKKGQLLIESKKDMIKRGVESPDVADALMLTFTGSAPEPFPDEDEDDSDRGKPLTAGLLNKNI